MNMTSILYTTVSFIFNDCVLSLLDEDEEIPEVRDPGLVPIKYLPDSHHVRIVLFGCGPASISCATFLARLSYTNVTILSRWIPLLEV